MPRFDRALAALAAELDVPQPDRVRIIEEIAADLEALHAELIASGLGDEEAEAKAIELLAPSEVARSALVGVHEPRYRSLARRFSPDAFRRLERGALFGVTLAALGIALVPLAREGLLRGASPFLWPVLAVAAAITTGAGVKALQLWLERDHRPARLHGGMRALLVGSGVAVALAVGGSVVESATLAARIEAAPEQEGALVLPWLLDTAVLLSVGLTTALLGGLLWMTLTHKIHAIERAEARTDRIVGGHAARTFLSVNTPSTPAGAHR